MQNTLFTRTKIQPFAFLDPAKFNDPIALKTSWRPQSKGGVKMRNMRLRTVSENRVEFEMTPMALLGPTIFMVATITFVAGILTLKTPIGSFAFNLLSILALICFTIAAAMIRNDLVPRQFDKELGYFWIGEPEIAFKETKFVGEGCHLSEIHAVQLIQGSLRYDINYEINLVMENGRRINLIGHVNRTALYDDAQELARFLRVPMWDATITGRERI